MALPNKLHDRHLAPESLTQKLDEAHSSALNDLPVSVFVHEARNALHLMASLVEIMKHELCGKENGDGVLVGSLGHLNAEIQDLVQLVTRFQANKLFCLNCEATNLSAVVLECLKRIDAFIVQRRIQIQYETECDLPLIMADRAKLREVLLNICRNAAEAMPSGGTIGIKIQSREGRVFLDIADTGTGIPKHINILQPFVSTKGSGRGLGLAIVRWIVFAHRGTLTYDSDPGEGTVFHLSFPTHQP
jgi:signal transduction histidine kinase